MKFGQEIGIDLGTANILVFVRSRGIILNEPSVVAIDTNTRQVKAVGEEARQMLGRTPGNIVAIRPMSDGVIAEYTTTVQMLRYLIQKSATGPRIFKRKSGIANQTPLRLNFDVHATERSSKDSRPFRRSALE